MDGRRRNEMAVTECGAQIGTIASVELAELPVVRK
jgi:hypothetical protein